MTRLTNISDHPSKESLSLQAYVPGYGEWGWDRRVTRLQRSFDGDIQWILFHMPTRKAECYQLYLDLYIYILLHIGEWLTLMVDLPPHLRVMSSCLTGRQTIRMVVTRQVGRKLPIARYSEPLLESRDCESRSLYPIAFKLRLKPFRLYWYHHHLADSAPLCFIPFNHGSFPCRTMNRGQKSVHN